MTQLICNSIVPSRWVMATGNAHKAEEVEAILTSAGVLLHLESAERFGGMQGCEETAPDFEGNARIKVQFLRHKVPKDYWILSDDSGLVVDALAGRPGVRSARYAGPAADDAANVKKLLGEMRAVLPFEKRTARFVCVLVCRSGDGVCQSFQGTCEGHILEKPKGDGGFGYDPIFQPLGESQSFAELSQEAKNRMSHRGKALDALIFSLTNQRPVT